MEEKNKEYFRSMDCEDCQCNSCLAPCIACHECYRVEFALEDWEDFYYPYDGDRSHCFEVDSNLG